MRIALLGATSQIARDLLLSFATHGTHAVTLYARRPEVVDAWLASVGLGGRYRTASYDSFQPGEAFEALINFVGVGDPAQAAAIGADILEVTHRYDQLALDYVRQRPQCRYLFLSSGAAYGASFDAPAERSTRAALAINDLASQDWYGVAKLYAECRHRAMPELPIVDIRVFSYFSRSQDPAARFLISDMLRAIHSNSVLQTSADYMVRDYLHPSDFHRLVEALLAAPASNAVVDCYSLAPIDKPALLSALEAQFGLRYAYTPARVGVDATGAKPHYYSLNRRAADFGYAPGMTSLQGVVTEMRAVLQAASGTPL